MRQKDNAYVRRIRDLVMGLVGGHRVRVYFFGSRAEGKASPGSDVDIGLEGPEVPLVISRIREVLEESTIPYKVDVVDLGTVDPEFREFVHSTGVLWKDWN